MRLNLPVNSQEFVVREDMLMVSRTDLKGLINYANEDFVEASGYEEQELLGQPHNLVRHPDMPEAAFADLWATLKAGRPWRGIVKNRRKDGGFYWVLAQVTPIKEGGRSLGYLSVRTRAEPPEIAAASAAYRRLREGEGSSINICQGRIVHGRSCRRWFDDLLHGSSIAPRLALAGLLLALPLLILLLLLLRSLNGEVQFAQESRRALAQHRAASAVVRQMQLHRGMTALHFVGDQSAAAGLAAKAQEIGQAWQIFDQLEAAQGVATTAMTRSESWRKQWDDVQSRALNLDFHASIDAQTSLINQGFKLMAAIADRSGFTRAKHADSFVAADLLTYRLPQLIKPLGESRAFGIYASGRGIADADALRPLLALPALSQGALAAIHRDLAAIAESNPDLAQRLQPSEATVAQTLERFLALIERRLRAPSRSADDVTPAQFLSEATAAIDAAFAFYEQTAGELDQVLAARAKALHQRLLWLGGGAALLVLLALGVGALLLTDLLKTLRVCVNHFDRIAAGHFGDTIDTARQDALGKVLQGQQVMQVHAGFELTEAQRLMQRSERRKAGLDAVSKGVLLTEGNGRIIFANAQLRGLLLAASADFATVRPGFDAAQLYDYTLAELLPEGVALWTSLASATLASTREFAIGRRHYRLCFTPVREQGKFLGYAVEWLDRSEELAVEREVAALLAAAAQGDFSVRLALENKQGFFRELALSVNRLLELSQSGLAEIARVIGAIARGDLTEQITGDYAGTLATLKDDTNRSVAQLREIVTKIRDSAEVIHTAAREIAAGNADLSARTEAQAASLEETAASMQELTATVKQNADNARQANTLAHEAAEVATRGGEAVGEVVQTMQGIHAAAKRIADIIGVIDGIAFQTNILALNAAVEAARAGEQGRGFAVVAAEVRNLAQRVAAAAKEVKGLIGDSSSRIEAGASQVQAAGKTMNEILLSAHQVSALVADISSASTEQYSGIEQINQAIAQMDQTTQQNAALVEQATAGAEELSTQAAALAQAVSEIRAVGSHRTPLAQTEPPIAHLRPAQPIDRRARSSDRPPNVAPFPARGGSATHSPRLTRTSAVNADDDWEEF